MCREKGNRINAFLTHEQFSLHFNALLRQLQEYGTFVSQETDRQLVVVVYLQQDDERQLSAKIKLSDFQSLYDAVICQAIAQLSHPA
jgi:hypothetical protein